jgi:hypothetical protein
MKYNSFLPVHLFSLCSMMHCIVFEYLYSKVLTISSV